MIIPGQGLLQGMWVTGRTFLGTYPWGRGLLKLFGAHAGDGLVTVQYPEITQQHAERFRYYPFLVYDEQPGDPRCVACKICEKECPPQCIFIEIDRDEQGRQVRRPKTFNIDIATCMSCNICVEVCPFEAIKMDKAFELSAYDRYDSLLLTKEQLLKSNQYFHQISPSEADGVDATLAAKAKKPTVPANPANPSNPANPATS